MSKLVVIFLFVSIYIAFAPAHGILKRIKNKLQPQPQVVDKVILVAEQPCRSNKCRPEYVDEYRPCQSSGCSRCHTECYGNNRCQNDCIIVDKCRNTCNGNESCQSQCVIVDQCRNSCNGNYQCINECNVPRQDRCSGCSVYNDDQPITHCDPGKWLYYVQVPRNISINDFVSNSDLLNLYTNSNLDLDSSGISGRACLNDRTRFDLQRLNATIQQIPNTKK